MVEEFAKLFGKGRKQILVKLDGDQDNRPEVRIYFKPPKLGVSSVAFGGWEDNEDGWSKAEAAFLEIDQEKAEQIVLKVTKAMR